MNDDDDKDRMRDWHRRDASNFIRVAILVLSIVSLGIDGLGPGDLIGAVAVILWLWASFFIQAATRVLAWINDNRR